MGDLRENFEYKSARERHEYLNSRLAALHRDLGRARPIDFDNLDLTETRIGARLILLAANGNERELAVLGPWESRPESGVVSYESELGKALLGKRVGCRSAPSSTRCRASNATSRDSTVSSAAVAGTRHNWRRRLPGSAEVAQQPVDH